jgi:hypothetical protein
VLALSVGDASAQEAWYFVAPMAKNDCGVVSSARCIDDAAWARIRREWNKPNASAEVIAAWYLDMKAPLRQWWRMRAFDSAPECEQWRRRLLAHPDDARSLEDVFGYPHDEVNDPKGLGVVQIARLRYGLCVAANDPRLKCVGLETPGAFTGRCQ